MNKMCLALAFLLFAQINGWGQKIPQAVISNGKIRALLYLPNNQTGYYRGTRFDWAGVMPRLEYNGHTYFGQWFEYYEPTIHDAIMGPVEAFEPLGYETAEVGGSFVKIGVGILEKPDNSAYHFSKTYKIIDNGEWEIKTQKDKIIFVHRIKRGQYPYDYKKTIKLRGNRMIIHHKLKNHGSVPMDTNVFNHNFFVIDGQHIGPGIYVEVPFSIKGDSTHLGGFAEILNNRIEFLKPLGEKDHPMVRNLSGFGPTNDDYNIRVVNAITRTGVKITSNRPLSKMVFWSAIKTLSPEPYTAVKIDASKSFTWKITYEFYTY